MRRSVQVREDLGGSAHREELEWMHAFVVVDVLVVALITVSVGTLVDKALLLGVVVLDSCSCCGPCYPLTEATKSYQLMG